MIPRLDFTKGGRRASVRGGLGFGIQDDRYPVGMKSPKIFCHSALARYGFLSDSYSHAFLARSRADSALDFQTAPTLIDSKVPGP